MLVGTILLHNEIFWLQDGWAEHSTNCTQWQPEDWKLVTHCFVTRELCFDDWNMRKYALVCKHRHMCRSNSNTFLIIINNQLDAQFLLYTGLFKMIVGVLTTCHTQYTWDSSTCIFYLIEQHYKFLWHTLQVLYMCTLCDSTNINTKIEFVPNCNVSVVRRSPPS